MDSKRRRSERYDMPSLKVSLTTMDSKRRRSENLTFIIIVLMSAIGGHVTYSITCV